MRLRMIKHLFSFVVIVTAMFVNSCQGVEPGAIQLPAQSFIIEAEEMPAFDDRPQFNDAEHDKWFEEEVGYKRFTIPQQPTKGGRYFKDGIIDVDIKGLTEYDGARAIAEKVGDTIFGDRRAYRIKLINKNGFGYYVFIEWGDVEKNISGHVLHLMIDFEHRVIWWSKCG